MDWYQAAMINSSESVSGCPEVHLKSSIPLIRNVGYVRFGQLCIS
jgi:hypothetical protein